MKTIAISIDEGALARLDMLAAKQNGKRRNRSQVFRRALEEYLTRLERQALDERELEIYRRNRKLFRRQAAALIKQQVKL